MDKALGKTTKKTMKDFSYAIGRRKEAVARARLYPHVKEGQVWGKEEVKKEQILLNEQPIEKYFPGPHAKAAYTAPLRLTDTLDRFAFTIRVTGGGPKGQLEAVIKSIARVLVAHDSKFREVLKDKGYMTRDARVRERRKVGRGGKARRKKQSPKR